MVWLSRGSGRLRGRSMARGRSLVLALVLVAAGAGLSVPAVIAWRALSPTASLDPGPLARAQPPTREGGAPAAALEGEVGLAEADGSAPGEPADNGRAMTGPGREASQAADVQAAGGVPAFCSEEAARLRREPLVLRAGLVREPREGEEFPQIVLGRAEWRCLPAAPDLLPEDGPRAGLAADVVLGEGDEDRSGRLVIERRSLRPHLLSLAADLSALLPDDEPGLTPVRAAFRGRDGAPLAIGSVAAKSRSNEALFLATPTSPAELYQIAWIDIAFAGSASEPSPSFTLSLQVGTGLRGLVSEFLATNADP